MDVRVFKARQGAHISDDDAQRIGGYLADKFGDHRVRPADFVISARPKSSPLHDDLEWDDKTAGEQWRMEQARKILGALMVVHVDDGGHERITRAYHNVVVDSGAEDAERAYVPQHVVWRSADLREQVITAAARDVDRAATKLDQYEDLASQSEGLRIIAAQLRGEG